MNQVKTHQTKRKFYNKWLYKVSVSAKGLGLFRVIPLDTIELVCLDPSITRYRWYLEDNNDSGALIKIARTLLQEPKDHWSLRIESKTMDIYTNSFDFYELLSKKLARYVFRRYQPDPKNLDIVKTDRQIVCKKLPHKKYQYRVYLKPHTLGSDTKSKSMLADWLSNYGEGIRCTDSVKNWFIRTTWNWDRRYVLVEDEAVLLMMKMRCGNAAGTVYQYVVVDK